MGADRVTVAGKCGHNFHMHCIMEWIKQEAAKGQCPMCRQSKISILETSWLLTRAAFEWNEPPTEPNTQVE